MIQIERREYKLKGYIKEHNRIMNWDRNTATDNFMYFFLMPFFIWYVISCYIVFFGCLFTWSWHPLVYAGQAFIIAACTEIIFTPIGLYAFFCKEEPIPY